MNLNQRIAEIVPKMGGWCSIEKGQELALAVLKTHAKVVVEIGVLNGRSFLPMAMALKEQGSGTAIAIDPWSAPASVVGQNEVNANWWGRLDHESIYQDFLANVKKNGVSDFVRVLRQPSDNVKPPSKIDVLHIDGNHSEQAIRDVERFASKVVRGGFVFCDDIGWDGGAIQKAVELLLSMGFVKSFDRDTGAMFERTSVIKLKKKKAGK